jgi:phosphocarrier protein
MTRVEQNVTVEHDKGLHARPASVFVQTASNFDSDIEVAKGNGDQTADAKSSIGVISLGVEPGDAIVITAEGDDAKSAVDSLVTLVNSDFTAEPSG